MKSIPERIQLAHLPTPIQKMDQLSRELGKNIYIKRDDYTGVEISGNKIRKLEFAAKEALQQQADVLITCGGLQSNHARATAAAARRLGLKCHLVLRGTPGDSWTGNLFLDKLLGAEITFLEPETFNSRHMEVMEEIKHEYAKKQMKSYLLPVGASNGIGTFGYYAAYEEICQQEKNLDQGFDAIVTAVGSGGTCAGLVMGNWRHEGKHRIIGVPVADNATYFRGVIQDIMKEATTLAGWDQVPEAKTYQLIDGYVGRGYALNTSEEMAFIEYIAQKEGIILDPVYTGKAFRGLVEEIRKGSFDDLNDILFIHTGGLFGIFDKIGEF
ncbi:MAG: D-cysteine desulfhydrase family protein [Tindallia sp. MSAO_Bac2]|nr:MAG: D-cysteine desulfhydrase family protein [Tindallia sp. MSAO_Bac2]